MPGKPDYGAGGEVGQYYPGSKEYRAWDEGFLARYALAAIGTNPHPAGSLENIAWGHGYNEADANSGGTRRMPATTGAPGVIP